jgi:hypothetical protein
MRSRRPRDNPSQRGGGRVRQFREDERRLLAVYGVPRDLQHVLEETLAPINAVIGGGAQPSVVRDRLIAIVRGMEHAAACLDDLTVPGDQEREEAARRFGFQRLTWRDRRAAGDIADELGYDTGDNEQDVLADGESFGLDHAYDLISEAISVLDAIREQAALATPPERAQWRAKTADPYPIELVEAALAYIALELTKRGQPPDAGKFNVSRSESSAFRVIAGICIAAAVGMDSANPEAAIKAAKKKKSLNTSP